MDRRHPHLPPGWTGPSQHLLDPFSPLLLVSVSLAADSASTGNAPASIEFQWELSAAPADGVSPLEAACKESKGSNKEMSAGAKIQRFETHNAGPIWRRGCREEHLQGPKLGIQRQAHTSLCRAQTSNRGDGGRYLQQTPALQGGRTWRCDAWPWMAPLIGPRDPETGGSRKGGPSPDGNRCPSAQRNKGRHAIKSVEGMRRGLVDLVAVVAREEMLGPPCLDQQPEQEGKRLAQHELAAGGRPVGRRWASAPVRDAAQDDDRHDDGGDGRLVELDPGCEGQLCQEAGHPSREQVEGPAPLPLAAVLPVLLERALWQRRAAS